MEERLKTHHESLSRLVEFTKSADHKAAPILAVHIALGGTLAARFENLLALLEGLPSDVASILLAVLMVLYVGFTLTSFWMAVRVFFPITSPPSGHGDSLIYFEDIQAMSLEDFVERATQMDSDENERQLLQQIYAVSHVVSAKMNRVKWAFRLSIPSIILWAVLIAWGNI